MRGLSERICVRRQEREKGLPLRTALSAAIDFSKALAQQIASLETLINNKKEGKR